MGEHSVSARIGKKKRRSDGLMQHSELKTKEEKFAGLLPATEAGQDLGNC